MLVHRRADMWNVSCSSPISNRVIDQDLLDIIVPNVTLKCLCIFDESLVMCEVYMHMIKHGARGVFVHVECDLVWGSMPTGVNWVSDGVGIDFIETRVGARASHSSKIKDYGK